jgi:hypothetical protein
MIAIQNNNGPVPDGPPAIGRGLVGASSEKVSTLNFRRTDVE